MRQTTVTISEENDKAARIEGARQLGVQPDEVTVVQVDKATYIVSMKNAPGQFDIVIREDKMGATIKTITPPLGNGKPVTVEDIKHALADLNIVVGINMEVIVNIVSEVIDTDTPRNNIQVAVGESAKSGKDGRIELKIGQGAVNKDPSANSMVKQGQIVAVRIPATKGAPGRNIFGEEVPAEDGKDVNFAAGDNVIITEDGITFIAALYGEARSTSKDVSVTNLVKANKSGMWAKMSIFPTLADNSKLTFEDVWATLVQTSIVHGIKEDLIKEVIEAGEPVRNLTVAEATPAKDGVDARIELKFQQEKIAGTIDERSGRIDYKKRGSIQSVKAGDILAVKTPLTHGKEGVNVFGDIITAEPGTDKVLTPASNVEVSDDGLIFTSEIDGMVILTRDNKIWVSKQYEIPGDVDYSTGNLSMDGSLNIKGWIRSGFDVRASGEIRVGGGIEDATVKAGGDIYIHGGIIGSGEGRVHAGGNLTARFFENATVHSDGNIFVCDDILRSTVSANGSIIVTEGKGSIRGGSVEAVKGIEVNEIGSDAGVRTRVSVGRKSKARKLLPDVTKRLIDFKHKRAKMDMILAQYVKKYKKKALPKETSRKLGKLVKLRREIVSKETRMIKYRKELVQKMSETEIEPVAVKVKKTAYFGTTVVVCGYGYYVKEDIGGKVMFVPNAEQQSIELVG